MDDIELGMQVMLFPFNDLSVDGSKLVTELCVGRQVWGFQIYHNRLNSL